MKRTSEKTSRDYKLYTMKDLAALTEDSQPWMIKNLIPRAGRVLAYGRGGEFKSALFFDISVAVASAGRMIECVPIETYGPVVLVSTEGTIYSIQKRILGHLRVRNTNPEICDLYYGRQPLRVNEPVDKEIFKSILRDVKPVLAVLDPYASCYSGDEDSTKDVKNFVAVLDECIAEFGCTVALIHHANKLGELRGSTVLQGWADAILKFAVVRKVAIPTLAGKHDVLTVTAEKQRDGAPGKALSAIPIFDEKLGMVTFGMFDNMDVKRVRAVYLKLELLKYLRKASEPHTRAQLMEKFRVGQDVMDAALQWLENDRLIEAVEAKRSTGNGRQRGVAGWQASATSKVDAACAILRAEKLADDGIGDV